MKKTDPNTTTATAVPATTQKQRVLVAAILDVRDSDLIEVLGLDKDDIKTWQKGSDLIIRRRVWG